MCLSVFFASVFMPQHSHMGSQMTLQKSGFPFSVSGFQEAVGWRICVCLQAKTLLRTLPIWHSASYAESLPGTKKRRQKKTSSHSSFLFSSQKPLLLDRNLMGENKEMAFYTHLMQLLHFFIQKAHAQNLFVNSDEFSCS